jgi:hypothetical protein
MFTRLATFRRLGLWHFVPHWLEAARSDDNTLGSRRPVGRRRSLQAMLACHWVLIHESRLECRWSVEGFDEASDEESDGCAAASKKTTDSERWSHPSSFSAKAIGHSRTSFSAGCDTLLHRNPRRYLQNLAPRVGA